MYCSCWCKFAALVLPSLRLVHSICRHLGSELREPTPDVRVVTRLLIISYLPAQGSHGLLRPKVKRPEALLPLPLVALFSLTAAKEHKSEPFIGFWAGRIESLWLHTYIGTTSLCGKLQDRATQPASTVIH